jgi:hypothetical protein
MSQELVTIGIGILEEYLQAYIKGAGIEADAKGFLFRTSRGRTDELSDRPISQLDVYRMIVRRAKDANMRTKCCCHSFRANGDHGIFAKRRQARSGAADGKSRICPYYGPLRLSQ